MTFSDRLHSDCWIAVDAPLPSRQRACSFAPRFVRCAPRDIILGRVRAAFMICLDAVVANICCASVYWRHTLRSMVTSGARFDYNNAAACCLSGQPLDVVQFAL